MNICGDQTLLIFAPTIVETALSSLSRISTEGHGLQGYKHFHRTYYHGGLGQYVFYHYTSHQEVMSKRKVLVEKAK